MSIEDQRRRTSMTESKQPVLDLVSVSGARPTTPTPPAAIASEPFNWQKDEDCIVVHHQAAVAIYRNEQGSLVIRQERDWNEDEDQIIVITKAAENEFMSRLRDACGGPSSES